MSDPTRLLDDQRLSAATSKLLSSLKPPAAAPPAVRSALAQQLGGLVAHGAAPAATAGVAWLKVALLSAAVAGSGAAVWKVSSRPAAPSVQAAPSVVAPLPAAPSPPTPPSSPSTAPAEQARPVERPRTAAAASAPVEPRDKLAEEEALLEQARTLVAQNPARALGLLRKHQSQFPGGQLAPERMYLSVDCLRRLGRQGDAKRESDALVSSYPNSAYARRAPQLLSPPAR